MKENKVQRNYKDTVFRMLFKEKENLLSLYNALNQTAYTDADGLEITTLENAVYMNYKNDISFVFDFELMLYEHQSTVNPNMPLRDLIYVTKVLQGRIKGENLYGTALVRIPTPRFVIFYNGTDSCPERQILRLSDAVETAVEHCIQNGILEEFLTKNRAEAIAMSIFEYNEEQHLKSEREQAYQNGRDDRVAIGRKEGYREGESCFAHLLQILMDTGRSEDINRVITDQTYREQLYLENHLSL